VRGGEISAHSDIIRSLPVAYVALSEGKRSPHLMQTGLNVCVCHWTTAGVLYGYRTDKMSCWLTSGHATRREMFIYLDDANFSVLLIWALRTDKKDSSTFKFDLSQPQ
jgi:hypothetical protein